MEVKFILKDFGQMLVHTSELEKNYNGFSLARIINEQKNLYKIVCDNGFFNARLKGSLLNNIESLDEYPRVGDFVAVEIFDDQAIIHGIIPRRNSIAKKVSGNRFDTQILATNLDCVFIVMSLNQDYNLRRLERYLSIAKESSIKCVVLLTKSDLCEDYQKYVDECKSISLTVDVYPISALHNKNMDLLSSIIKPALTYAFVGSSGAGKSTIINYLMEDDVQKTLNLSTNNKGKHTTTSRELFLLPNGGIVIDTPGMKTIGLLDDEESIYSSFGDLEELAERCHFKDCTHKLEPGCKVKEAISNGDFDESRLNNYNKLIKEAKYVEKKLNALRLKQKRK